MMEVKVLDDKTVCKIRGSIDATTSNRIFSKLDQAKETSEFHFDLAQVSFVNTYFIKELIKSKERFRDSKFFIINPSPHVLELLHIMQVEQFASVVKHNTSDFMFISN